MHVQTQHGPREGSGWAYRHTMTWRPDDLVQGRRFVSCALQLHGFRVLVLTPLTGFA